MEVIEQWLSARKGQKVRIVVPKKGEKERLVELAQKNASMVLRQDFERNQTRCAPWRHERGGVLAGTHRVCAAWKPSIFPTFPADESSGLHVMRVYGDAQAEASDYRKFQH